MTRIFARSILCAAFLASTLSAAAAQSSTTDVNPVNQRQVDGSTPLQWAVYNGDVIEVQRLLKAGANVSIANNYGVTAMELAAEVANTPILKLLLDAVANVASPNPDGQTALLAVARTGNLEAAQLLLDRGAKVDAKEKFGGQTALMWASARRHPKMMELLISRGANVNARGTARDYQRHVQAEGRPKNLDSGGLTPLLYATRENCGACSDVLVRNKVDINLPDPDGVSPLLLAIMNANWDRAKQLIEAGADVNQWDVFGESPLFNAVGPRHQLYGGKGANDPRKQTTGIQIVKTLLERGANPNMQLLFRPANLSGSFNTRGATPLIRAVSNNDMEVVKLLLQNGADATINMADRQTPIMAAIAGRGSEAQVLEMITLLHDAGADVNSIALVVHREDSRGGTALHYAARKRYKEVIKKLASYGIDMNAKDQDGLTALDYTQSRGYMAFMALQTPKYADVATLLRELGATVEFNGTPNWPILGPPQGIEADIWPVGETAVHAPFYTHAN